MKDEVCGRCYEELDPSDYVVKVEEGYLPDGGEGEDFIGKGWGRYYHQHHFPDLDKLARKPGVGDYDMTAIGTTLLAMAISPAIVMFLSMAGVEEMNVGWVYILGIGMGMVATAIHVMYDGYRLVRWKISE